MSTAVALRNVWSELIVDAGEPRFLEQAVSIATSERPKPSVVGDDIWYFPIEIVAGVDERRALIDFGVPCGDGLLTDERYASLLLVAKHYAVLKMARPFRRFLDLSTIKTRLEMAFGLFRSIAFTSFPRGRTRLADQTVDDLRACIVPLAAGWRAGSSSFVGLRTVLL